MVICICITELLCCTPETNTFCLVVRIGKQGPRWQSEEAAARKKQKGETSQGTKNLGWENTPFSLIGLARNQSDPRNSTISLFAEGVANQGPGTCSGAGTRDIKERSQTRTGSLQGGAGVVPLLCLEIVLLTACPVNLACLGCN